MAASSTAPAPARTADIAIVDGTIAAIGRVDDSATTTIDADGLLVTPGFVDIHTHYDAQLNWDPTASPASWHGVTTLLTGNCGFTLAPSRPDDLGWLLLMLSRVEGMSADALAAGVTFRGGSLGDFLANLDGRVGVNVGANVGHCAVRRFVMGDDASERGATDDEIAADARPRARCDARRCDRVHVVAARAPRRARWPGCAVELRVTRRARRAHGCAG